MLLLLNNGNDCNALVSYGTGIGSSVSFGWRAVKGFQDARYKINDAMDYSAAQPGDYLGNSGHIMMVIENDPETKTMIVAESTFDSNRVMKWTYDEVFHGKISQTNGGYSLYDGSRFYLDE